MPDDVQAADQRQPRRLQSRSDRITLAYMPIWRAATMSRGVVRCRRYGVPPHAVWIESKLTAIENNAGNREAHGLTDRRVNGIIGLAERQWADREAAQKKRADHAQRNLADALAEIDNLKTRLDEASEHSGRVTQSQRNARRCQASTTTRSDEPFARW